MRKASRQAFQKRDYPPALQTDLMIQATVRQLLAGAFSYLGAEKKQSHFWLCFEWRVGFKILF
jgi:hypothetical protein